MLLISNFWEAMTDYTIESLVEINSDPRSKSCLYFIPEAGYPDPSLVFQDNPLISSFSLSQSPKKYICVMM